MEREGNGLTVLMGRKRDRNEGMKRSNMDERCFSLSFYFSFSFSFFLSFLTSFLLSQFFRSTNVLIYGLFSRTLQYFFSLFLSRYISFFLFLCCFITFGSFIHSLIHSFVLSLTQSVTHSSSSPFLIHYRFTKRGREREESQSVRRNNYTRTVHYNNRLSLSLLSHFITVSFSTRNGE